MKTRSKKAAKKTPKKSCLTFNPQELDRRVTESLEHFAKVDELLPGLVELKKNARIHSQGRLRDDESDAMIAILDAADVKPVLFLTLADKDNGVDPDVFESWPTRDDLARRKTVERMSRVVQSLATRIADSILHLGARARGVTSKAYGIAQKNAELNEEIATKLAPAVSFYGEPARVRASRQKKAKRGKKPPTP